ncbi:MAG: alpha/beta hydrolase [Verrucomicrobiota bacterium]
MKYLALVLFLFVWISAPTSEAQEERPLWSKEATPHLPAETAEEPVVPFLDVYLTKETAEHSGAAVVICPGGGYGGLAVDHEGRQPALWFAEQGVSAFVLHYRLGSQGYHHPAQLSDVQRAIRLVRSQAKQYDLDPSRIAVMGFSAGGHLASMAATLYEKAAYEAADEIDSVSARPDFAILCYPVISLESEFAHRGSRKNLLGPDRFEDDTLAASLSSERNVDESTPPAFLFQTDADTSVPAENAVAFYLALRKHGVPAELHSYQEGPHGVGLYRGDPVLGTWSGLLSNWLQANSFFAPAKPRIPIQGSVTLNGKPISWGVLTFYPEEEGQPITSVRVRRGSFSADAEKGPVAGKATIRLEGSIWEATRDKEDRALLLEVLNPQDEAPIQIEVKEGLEPIQLDFTTE